jgi:hypothetical protein
MKIIVVWDVMLCSLIGTNLLEDRDSSVYHTTLVRISDCNLNSAFYIHCPHHCNYYWSVFTV